jgi:hypothetical protein
LHPMSIGKMIFTNNSEINNNVVSINSLGKNRIKIVLNTATAANKLVQSNYFITKNIDVYIPQFMVRRQGIIKGVDTQFTESEIKQCISPMSNEVIQVLEVKRFTRKQKINEQTIFIPTQTVLVSFEGQQLPKYICIHKVCCAVEPYVQKVVQCFKCLRYGHIQSQCRSKPRCSKCLEEHLSNSCTNVNTSPLCLNCKGNHQSTDRNNCPEFSKQKSIKVVMGNNNLSYREAVESFNSSFSGITQISKNQVPFKNNIQSFPPLNSPKRKRREETNVATENIILQQKQITKALPSSSGNGTCINPQTITSSSELISTLVAKIAQEVLNIVKNSQNSNFNLEAVLKKQIENIFSSHTPWI